jgi:hypothetical protein
MFADSSKVLNSEAFSGKCSDKCLEAKACEATVKSAKLFLRPVMCLYTRQKSGKSIRS